MRSLALATALLLAPGLASAQLTHTPEASRTYAGCNAFLCATLDFVYVATDASSARPAYRYDVSGTAVVQPGAVAGGYRFVSGVVLRGPLFNNSDFENLMGLSPDNFMVGPVGSVVALQSEGGPLWFGDVANLDAPSRSAPASTTAPRTRSGRPLR